MAFFAMSDIHGDRQAFEEAWARLSTLRRDEPVYVLGDLIDGGAASGAVLQRVYELANGDAGVKLLLGNHEAMFLDFLEGTDDLDWLTQDTGFNTTKSFFTATQWQALVNQLKADPTNARQSVVTALWQTHRQLFEWLSARPLIAVLPRQVLVHAGIDETIPDWQAFGLSRDILLSKFPPTTGYFEKVVIAGHVSSRQVAHDQHYLGHIYYDHASHYFIDGDTLKSHRVPVLYWNDHSYQEV
ncbi:metallophosphoesterase [Lacticaseibacillus porcinae]|uniref:metallophosphoesterase n=1 Tax=Lacticaseibacillus porcinae TaxID=1123687 RepID=UPI000F7B25EC|nr:metallophosphoesterase [Lacticaseibacillus porcinae]